VRIRWTEKAGRNLDQIATYISQDSPHAALNTVIDIIEAVEQLRDFPAMGRPGRVAGTRELVIPGKPYVVPYRVKESVIEILRVFHTARKHEGK
jgi:addiction module RelE/StbE family toxin